MLRAAFCCRCAAPPREGTTDFENCCTQPAVDGCLSVYSPKKAECSAHISALQHKCGRSTPLSVRQLGFTASAYYYVYVNQLTTTVNPLQLHGLKMLKCSLYKVVVGTNALGNGGILCGLNLVGGVDAHIVEEQVAASLKTGIAGLLLDGLVLALVDNLYIVIAHQVEDRKSVV